MTLEQINGQASQGELTSQDRQTAQVAERRLRRVLEASETGEAALEFRLAGASEPEETMALPLSALRLLDAILEANAQGQAMTVVPLHDELTPNGAAERLGVSRPFLVKLLDEGRIPFRRVGAHRRIRVDDLGRYQAEEEQRQLETLAALQAQAQELGMGY